MIMKIFRYLLYGIILGVPAGIISSIVLIPMYLLITNVTGISAIGILGAAIGFIVLGWWYFVVKSRVHILGG